MVQPTIEGVVRLDSLHAAWRRVHANGGGPGGDGVRLKEFDAEPLPILNRLRADVLAGVYWPGPIRRLRLEKASGGYRPLAIPCVVDRVLQTAVANAFTPLFEKEFEPSSYGYRPNRSVAQAVGRVAALRRQGFIWTVDADIRRYFENVAHALLLPKISALVEDKRLVDLVATWLEHAEPDGIGLPQGSPISPLLANLFLDSVDERLEGKNTRLVRYADDFVILCRSEATAQKALADAHEALAEHGLELNLEKTRIRPFGDAMTFLGRMFVRSLVLAGVNDPDELRRAIEVTEPLPDPDLVVEPATLSTAAHRLAPRLRTLYVYEADTRLLADGTHFVAVRDGRERLRVLARGVDLVEIGPHAQIDAHAIRLAAAVDAPVSFTNGWGHAIARLETGPHGAARLHLAQAAAVLDAPRRLAIARAFVVARLRSQRSLLRRLNARRKIEAVAIAAKDIGIVLRRLEGDTTRDLMGYEGAATRLYWPALGQCLEHGWTLSRRERRPPPDPVNLVLSFLASRLTADIDCLVRKSGLHPGFGFLHETTEGPRGTLALDIVEVFRAPLMEGLAIYLFNNRIMRPEWFVKGDEAVRLATPGLQAVIRHYESWLDRPIRSPFGQTDVLWRGLIEEQISALRAAIEAGTAPELYDMDHRHG